MQWLPIFAHIVPVRVTVRERRIKYLLNFRDAA